MSKRKKNKNRGVVLIEKGNGNSSQNLAFISQVILIVCGDYRLAAFVRKYLKRVYGYNEMDILTTAGGSKTIAFSLSFSAIKEVISSLVEYCKILFKRIALWIDFGAYYHHGAKICVLADHNLCGFWEYFLDDEKEQSAHIESLIKAGNIVKSKYPEIEKIILLYVILDKETHRAIKVIEVDLSGKTREVLVEEEEKLY